jgi:hypothetical protein
VGHDRLETVVLSAETVDRNDRQTRVIRPI